MHANFFSWKTNPLERGIIILLILIIRCSDDDGDQTLFVKVKNFLVFSRFKTRHQTNVNAQQGQVVEPMIHVGSWYS
jgi:hypothetical protein